LEKVSSGDEQTMESRATHEQHLSGFVPRRLGKRKKKYMHIWNNFNEWTDGDFIGLDLVVRFGDSGGRSLTFV
jgi:hypothetical protein